MTIPTHAVLNQPPPLDQYDLAAAEPTLLDALERDDGGWAVDLVAEFGRRVASPEVYQWGFLANRHPPELQSHDRYGNRIDRVEFHPAWHQLLDLSVGHGLHSLPWEPTQPKAGHLVRTSLTFLASQIEAGHFCPISMTYAALPALRQQPELAALWEPMVLSRTYDPSFQPASKKTGLLMGMGMTEKQGGSDVRAGTTQAVPADDGYLITGHKWFMSAPMSDAFLILAQAPGGLTCFLLPRFRPDGTVNEIRIQRLKDKLGNRSNASAEVEFDRAFAGKVGEEGRGVATIIEMVNGTRLDCVAGSAALMRQAVSQAIHHCRFRRVFGSALIDQPAMLNVLADLEVETEAAALLMTRLATAFDRSADDQHERDLRRIATPIAKFWVTKRCAEVVHEALECLGGNGFVEETILPRLFRESPLNAIWEGSGNVIALDVLRAAQANPASVEALVDEMSLGAGFDPRIDEAGARAIALLRNLSAPPAQARLVTEHLALAWQASLLARFARPEVAAAFVRSRLSSEGGRIYGTLPADADLRRIVEPAIPHLAGE
ncbi:MAG TPA: acyl-CoA dehydrogenase family protein [Acidimicrobiia bacterium]|nr:acyl-CoA dehydrogenase family protein [Acidimicrobiia bacterium]